MRVGARIGAACRGVACLLLGAWIAAASTAIAPAIMLTPMLLLTTPLAKAKEPLRRLSHIKGNVWRFQYKDRYAVLVVTSEGILVTDPLSADASHWLSEIVAIRFGKPVTHLVYSHSDMDHAAGGLAFREAGTVIAHMNAPEKLERVIPNVRVSDRASLVLGDHRFELTYLGPGSGTDLIAMVIRPENVAFIGDAVTPQRLPEKDFEGVDIDGLINQIRAIERLEFDLLAPGHGRLGTKADAMTHREYVEWLRAAVAAGLRAGQSIDRIVDTLDTSAYQDMMAYNLWREPNIRGMARWLLESGEVN